MRSSWNLPEPGITFQIGSSSGWVLNQTRMVMWDIFQPFPPFYMNSPLAPAPPRPRVSPLCPLLGLYGTSIHLYIHYTAFYIWHCHCIWYIEWCNLPIYMVYFILILFSSYITFQYDESNVLMLVVLKKW